MTNNITLKTINNILKKSDFYFIIESYFWKPGKFKIKKIEYDRKTPHNKERTRRENRGNFYLIYDSEDIENISEGVLYDEDKAHGLRFLFDRLNQLQKDKKQVFYTTRSRFATDGTAYDF